MIEADLADCIAAMPTQLFYTTQEITKQVYMLAPGRYVGIEEQEDDSELLTAPGFLPSAARGFVIKFIPKGSLENFAFAAPIDLATVYIIGTFAAFNQAIDNLTQENYRLAAIRDLLLPKFMSGEIDISNIQ